METAERKLGLDVSSRDEYHEYAAWSVGREERVYQHPHMDASVIIRLEGWASAEVVAAYERGEEGTVWPEFFYESRIEGPGVEGGVYRLTGGKIPVSELERQRAESPGNTTLVWAWSFILDQVERHL